MQQTSTYILPSCSSLVCDDRFDILEGSHGEGSVRFWLILEKLLSNDVSGVKGIIDILETITLTLGRPALCDYDVLESMLLSRWTTFSTAWLRLCELALELPLLFPGHHLPVLSPDGAQLELSRRQTACLVIHQFLCTLPAPNTRTDFFDFSVWYSSRQPHSIASTIYLTSILTYFDRLTNESPDSPLQFADWSINFDLRRSSPSHICVHRLQPIEVKHVTRDLTRPDYYGLPDGACVVSANKLIGFGQTGTQEERHVAASPESCPAVLITPVLEGSEVLVVTGAEAFVNIEGHGRDIELGEQLLPATNIVEHERMWRNRTMLFADALELDGFSEPLPDLLPGHVRREFTKALTAFISEPKAYSHIVTGFWGCGAFGGNPAVKALIQWCAASIAGTKLVFVCSSPDQSRFGKTLSSFTSDLLALDTVAEDLMRCIEELKPGDFHGCPVAERSEGIFKLVKSRLQSLSAANST